MARIDHEEGQWIVLMGFVVSVSIFFLAFIMSKATIVGQTTSEGVLEFPKSEIQDLRSELISITKDEGKASDPSLLYDIQNISLARKNAVVTMSITHRKYTDLSHDWGEFILHYNDGVTRYDETYLVPVESP
jgi:hypothetical protein